METLKSLTDVITRNKVKKIEVIGNPGENDTKLNKLYNGIKEGKINSNEDAIKILYNGHPDKNAFYKLKHTLKERLMNTLFFIDLKEGKYMDRERSYYSCMKEFLATEILGRRDEKDIAAKQAEKLLATTRKYGLTELSFMICRRLVIHYGTRSLDRKKFDLYTNMLLEYQSLLSKETIAQVRLVDLMSYYVNDKSTKKYIAEKAERYYREVESIKLRNPSSRIIYFMTMLQIAKYMSLNDYATTVVVCKKALTGLLMSPSMNALYIHPINFQLIASCIHLKRYEEAKTAIEQCFSLEEKGKINWFKTQELYLSLCFHTQRYQEAWDIFATVTRHRNFSKLSETDREMWKIYEAWVHFFIRGEKINIPEKEQQKLRPFRLSRFMNEVPVFSKDKRGMNVPVLVLQILFSLQQKEHDTLIDRVEAIGKYKDRYLDREHNYRSNCFIRMILEMEKTGFRKKETLAKTGQLFSNMLTVPIDISDQSHDLEIIPYDDTWEYMMEFLPGNFLHAAHKGNLKKGGARQRAKMVTC